MSQDLIWVIALPSFHDEKCDGMKWTHFDEGPEFKATVTGSWEEVQLHTKHKKFTIWMCK